MPIVGTFIEGGAGRILVVIHQPDALNRAVLVVPAFAEEMNKSRRLLWGAGTALAARGFSTLIPDLYGTGDSEGELVDARWDIWIEDLCRVVQWATEKGAEGFDVLTIRLGAALFADAQERMPARFGRAVAWQPVRNGAVMLKQLLRMKIMAMRMSGESTASLEALFQRLVAGPEPMELGGYTVSPDLAKAIERAAFLPDAMYAIKEGLVLEFGSSSAPNARKGDGTVWRHEMVAGERFWMAIEPTSNATLIETTARFFSNEQ